MRAKIFFLTVAALSILPIVRAQMPNASQQVDSLDQRRQIEQSAQSLNNITNVPALYEGETSDIGPQSVVVMKPRRTRIEAFADEQFFYTDNTLLANQSKMDADVLVSTIQAAIAPPPFEFHGGQVAPRIGYQHQWFNYDLAGHGTVFVYDANTGFFNAINLDALDFNVSTVFADAAWRKQNWVFTAGFDFRQLLDSGNYNEFYREYVPRWSVRREFPLSESIACSIAYEGDYRVTETKPPVPPNFPNGFNDRTDHSLVFVGSYRLCPHAFLQPYYRFEFTHYTQISRDDLLNSFGLTLYCPITKQITLRTFASYDLMNTDGFYAQNYRKLDAGAGLNLTVQF
jgi:hypothetical protein